MNFFQWNNRLFQLVNGIPKVWGIIPTDRPTHPSEPVMVYCQLDPKAHIWMKFDLKFKSIYWKKSYKIPQK